MLAYSSSAAASARGSVDAARRGARTNVEADFSRRGLGLGGGVGVLALGSCGRRLRGGRLLWHGGGGEERMEGDDMGERRRRRASTARTDAARQKAGGRAGADGYIELILLSARRPLPAARDVQLGARRADGEDDGRVGGAGPGRLPCVVRRCPRDGRGPWRLSPACHSPPRPSSVRTCSNFAHS